MGFPQLLVAWQARQLSRTPLFVFSNPILEEYLLALFYNIITYIKIWHIITNWYLLGGIYFPKKWRAETLRPALEFYNFKARLKVVFPIIASLWPKGLFSGGDDQGFLKEGVKPYLMTLKSLLNSPSFFFFCLHIYSLWSNKSGLKSWITIFTRWALCPSDYRNNL